MKIRKNYTVTILYLRNVAVLSAKNNMWVYWMQRNSTCGCRIYDCNFREAIENLKHLSNKGYFISKRK